MIDVVHDMQDVFRKLLHSMSRPGEISTIKPTTSQTNGWDCNEATYLTILTLLDAEVSFHIVSNKHKNVEKQIAEYTFARNVSIVEADFVIVLQGTEEQEILESMEKCKIGNLLDPQYAATWIFENERITKEGNLFLSGPGIQQQTTIQLDVTEPIIQARNERIKEFPLGIDMILTDATSQVACIPRTTKVVRNGGIQ
ncbi:phosphonate C-P lyase system protein PhnH [Ornithinibacillus salinisoli]|uniref:Phosphonate C-P lyase system protein PhnH n=1 Tax=Ornithinibacillus salinisoli TaxID=1848459 RepID=A0ABW4VYJ4_9BACI